MLLRFGANFHRSNVTLTHQFQAVDDVADLRLDHHDHGIVAQAGVGPEKDEEIREAANDHAKIRAHAVAPRVVNFQAVAAKQLPADELVSDVKAGSVYS